MLIVSTYGLGLQKRRFFMCQPNRNNNFLWRPYFGPKRMKFYKAPSVDASCQILYHSAHWFQRRNVAMHQPIISKNHPWRQCFSLIDTDWGNLIHDFHRCPLTNHTFGQGVSEDTIFYVSANEKQYSLKVAMFYYDQDKIRKLYKGPFIDAPYQI